MPVLTIDRFSKGLDLRRLPAVTDADRLLVARNVFVNKGGQIRRRPALALVADATGRVGSDVGLFYSAFTRGGEWLTFTAGAPFSGPEGSNRYSAVTLPMPQGRTLKDVLSVHSVMQIIPAGEQNAGAPRSIVYVVAELDDGSTRHYSSADASLFTAVPPPASMGRR